MIRVSSDDACSFCRKPYFKQEKAQQKTCIELTCNHIFHHKCMKPWLDTNKTCPLCRRFVKLDLSASESIIIVALTASFVSLITLFGKLEFNFEPTQLVLYCIYFYVFVGGLACLLKLLEAEPTDNCVQVRLVAKPRLL